MNVQLIVDEELFADSDPEKDGAGHNGPDGDHPDDDGSDGGGGDAD